MNLGIPRTNEVTHGTKSFTAYGPKIRKSLTFPITSSDTYRDCTICANTAFSYITKLQLKIDLLTLFCYHLLFIRAFISNI